MGFYCVFRGLDKNQLALGVITLPGSANTGH